MQDKTKKKQYVHTYDIWHTYIFFGTEQQSLGTQGFSNPSVMTVQKLVRRRLDKK